VAEHTIEELRDHLFGTLAALRDKDNPMDVERAHAVAEVAGKIIASATTEVAFLNAVGGKGSGFIPDAPRLSGPEHPKPRALTHGK